MENLYPILIAFVLVFLSELGDKTQLLVLSFSTKQKVMTILLGVVLGSLLSHGIAIVFGSSLGLIGNEKIETMLKVITHLSFIVFGIISLIPKSEKTRNKEDGIVNRIIKSSLNYIVVIALSIAIGELGDKTFLASIGLGIQYPKAKIALIIGAILGMVASDLIAILFGRIISKKIPEGVIEKFSGILFLLFGIFGLICL